MSTKTLTARLRVGPEEMRALWRTHELYNDAVRRLARLLLSMRRGECGATAERRDLYARIARFVLVDDSQASPYLLNSVCIRKWKPDSARTRSIEIDGETVTGESWAPEAAALSAAGELLFEKAAFFAGLSGLLIQKATMDAAALVSGHAALSANWERDHAAWLEERRAWEAANSEYLRVRPEFDAFAVESGTVTGRRLRWGRYLAWLQSRPDLAAWRGGPAVVHPVPADVAKAIDRLPASRRAGAAVRAFFSANPELRALDRLHGEYERRFARSHARRRSPDGYELRPTYTEPHPVRHPRWLVFSGPQSNPSGYRRFELPRRGGTGRLELNVLTADGWAWLPLAYRADERFGLLREATVKRKVVRGEKRGEEKERAGYEMRDERTGEWRPCELKGARLVFRMRGDERAPRAAYLYFTVQTQDRKFSDLARGVVRADEPVGADEGSRKAKAKRLVPDGTVVAAVHLGVRHFGYATLARAAEGRPESLRHRNLWITETGRGGPTLAHVAEHKRLLGKLRSARGRATRDERQHIRLTEHVDHMAGDRVKKQARAIIDFALNASGERDGRGELYPRADVVVLENYEGLIPNSERERGVNRAIVAMNRGRLVTTVREMARAEGIRVFELSPVGNSYVCSRCGRIGRRYSVGRGRSGQVEITFEPVGPLFACACGYRASAEHNDARNLLRRFFDPSACDAWREFRALAESQQRERVAQLEETLLRPSTNAKGLLAIHAAAEKTLVIGEA